MSPIYVPGKVTLAKEFTWNETVWNPSMISTALWLDAADASTITESGGAVSQWDDKSGNNLHATQTSSAARPLTNSETINNINAISFASQFFDLPDFSNFIAGSSNRFLFAVGKAASSDSPILSIGVNSPGTRWTLRVDNYNLRIEISGASYVAPNFTVQDYSIAGVGLSGSTIGDHTFFLNGVSSAASGTATVNTNASSENYISNSVVGAGSGVWGEFILLSSYPSEQTRQKLEGYLAHKWGLTANLPSDHPYKTVGPTP